METNRETNETPEAPGTPERKKPGPVPGPATRKYNVLIEEELAEWGKRQPRGLSELLRRLLKQAKKEAGEPLNPAPPGSRYEGVDSA